MTYHPELNFLFCDHPGCRSVVDPDSGSERGARHGAQAFGWKCAFRDNHWVDLCKTHAEGFAESVMKRIMPSDDHMRVGRMRDAIRSGWFTDSDGYGCYATETEYDPEAVFGPSSFDPPSWATHVVWFNR